MKDNNNHSVFLLYDHLVLVVNDRRQVMDDTISDYAKDRFVRLGKNYNISLVEWNHDMDHVHILFKAHPNRE
ncbi:transposase IS200 family protein [Geobacillus genomosp. 3]|uniref:Transposase IS200 family protein n=1 Tax=Geobacillus genomosp. 3 TaxID=1921421 RepID=V5LVK7_GEOG3|nr:transposase IS200 family protein [Geobacillus genomosp. 3]